MNKKLKAFLIASSVIAISIPTLMGGLVIQGKKLMAEQNKPGPGILSLRITLSSGRKTENAIRWGRYFGFTFDILKDDSFFRHDRKKVESVEWYFNDKPLTKDTFRIPWAEYGVDDTGFIIYAQEDNIGEYYVKVKYDGVELVSPKVRINKIFAEPKLLATKVEHNNQHYIKLFFENLDINELMYLDLPVFQWEKFIISSKIELLLNDEPIYKFNNLFSTEFDGWKTVVLYDFLIPRPINKPGVYQYKLSIDFNGGYKKTVYSNKVVL